ncbi:histidine kinase, partial [Streptomyces rubiginosohelvolus]
ESGRAEAPAPAAPPAPDTIGGLPRRVRQASLARQLREDSAERTVQRAPVDTFDDGERDADEVRNRMASLQRGWQRGRRENAGTTEDTANTGTTGNTTTTESAEDTVNTGDPGGTAPGTTPGGDGR